MSTSTFNSATNTLQTNINGCVKTTYIKGINRNFRPTFKPIEWSYSSGCYIDIPTGYVLTGIFTAYWSNVPPDGLIISTNTSADGALAENFMVSFYDSQGYHYPGSRNTIPITISAGATTRVHIITCGQSGYNSATNNVWFRGALIPYGEGLN